jgi:hypothetical protein
MRREDSLRTASRTSDKAEAKDHDQGLIVVLQILRERRRSGSPNPTNYNQVPSCPVRSACRRYRFGAFRPRDAVQVATDLVTIEKRNMKTIILATVFVLSASIAGCVNINSAPKIISANQGQQFAVACSGFVIVSGDQQSGYEVRFTDYKGQEHDWRGLHDVQIDEDPELTKQCLQSPDRAQAQAQPEQRQLSRDEIDSLRKRNECENRFTDRKIYEVGGISVGAACKQNPDRMP